MTWGSESQIYSLSSLTTSSGIQFLTQDRYGVSSLDSIEAFRMRFLFGASNHPPQHVANPEPKTGLCKVIRKINPIYWSGHIYPDKWWQVLTADYWRPKSEYLYRRTWMALGAERHPLDWYRYLQIYTYIILVQRLAPNQYSPPQYTNIDRRQFMNLTCTSRRI